MRTTAIALGFGAALCAAVAYLFSATAPLLAQPPASGSPPTRSVPAAVADTAAAERERHMNDVLREIAGREEAPSESVFTNIRVLTGVPAGRLVRIMNFGYGRSLGVGCNHCHVPGEWDKEDKPQKQVARDMVAMMGTINRELLPKISHLESKEPIVNCTTCHRGAIKPALNL